MTRNALLTTGALALALTALPAAAQDLQDRPVAPPPPSETPLPAGDEQVQFTADSLEYEYNADIVTARGDVRMYRGGDRLRAGTVTWNRNTGKVVANGDIAVTNPQGDVAYGDSIELTDSLKDGVIENMLVVLEQGGRIAARRGTRNDGGVITVEDAAYTACDVTTSDGCPKEPSWKISAVTVVYDPELGRIKYKGARISLFGIATIPLPTFSHPIGGRSANGFLAPEFRLSRVNGLEIAAPYVFSFGDNRDLTITPRVFTGALPMLQVGYRELNTLGAFRIDAYGTYSRRSDDLGVAGSSVTTQNDFRGYIDSVGRYQLSPKWSISESIRLASDRTFLRRYDISRDTRLRSTVRVERIDDDSYFSIAGWSVQTLRLTDNQGLQPIALPEIDYRRRFDDGVLGGRFSLQLNTLALTRTEGQDTQRAFASVQWDLRRLTRWGQEVTFTAFARGDLYNANDTLATTVASYRGDEGFQARAIGAVAVDVKWPFIGSFLGGTQRITPRVQLVASPRVANLSVPNEDARAVELEDSNLFALNRFPGYDRFEDSPRVTYGLDYAIDLPGLSIDAVVGQSYRLNTRPTILPDGTGLSDRFSDIVGRTTVRFRDFVSLTHRYRLDKDGLAVRRNEVDATVGTRDTYALIGYLRLNRNIGFALEDLQDREEARVGGRVQVAQFWSVFGSATVDLTDRSEDPLSISDGFTPIRHRLGVAYEDDCLRLGLTWKRDYETTGDARRGNSYLLTLSLKNLGR
ncbi:LPS assembly protein LptD [Sphingomonas donggukensis]|uniref:LPS-assembly protein LptD n=1 Tax=Sphingomonas donggukensis TaxID=2949093 RepID=A0ABY4TVS3_9SPHN|nr:LPS assembly protein LptD [Sphingomonas donggukensis]URW76493.1 LPS assembly protein LptD [Sphingomonas donggukensis]